MLSILNFDKTRGEGMFKRNLLVAAAAMTFAAAPALAQIKINPGVAALKSKPVDLAAIDSSLPQATLAYYFYGDVAPKTDVIYVDPAAKYRGVEFRTNIFKKSDVHAVRWQVSRAPFAGPPANPAALVDSGVSTIGVFEIDFADMAKKAGLDVPSAPTATKPGLKKTFDPNRLKKLVPKAPQSGEAPKLDPSVRAAIAGAGAVKFSPRFYVRVIPVDPANPSRIIGKPSDALPVIWGPKPDRQVEATGFQTVSQETFNLAVTKFIYHPSKTIEKWPAGCEEIPRDEGKDAIDVTGDAASAAVDLVNWASEAYGDLKNIVISAVGDLLPFIPREALSIALDVAMASAGLPPSLPNVDQLMEGGADYLAVQMASQIPTPASGVLAEMAADEARAEIQRRTKEAILKSAHDIASRQKSQTKWCTRYISDPYFEVSVTNKGDKTAEKVWLTMKPTTALLDPVTMGIESIAPDETLVLPIAYRSAKNIPWKWVSQIPEKDKEAAANQWWRDYYAARFGFS
ncbi:MAG: hypothetical protein R3C60_14995, partial [Parvularculaceae bacterium]